MPNKDYTVMNGKWCQKANGNRYWTGTKEDLLLDKKAGLIAAGTEIVVHERTIPLGSVIMNVCNFVPGFIMLDGREFDTEVLTELLVLYPDGHVPDWREASPTGAGQSARVAIANHDVYNVNEFKDDTMAAHTHNVAVTIPDHAHTVTDNGHTHTIDTATTGLTIVSNTTGLDGSATTGSATTGLTVNSGIAINNSATGTGISVDNAGKLAQVCTLNGIDFPYTEYVVHADQHYENQTTQPSAGSLTFKYQSDITTTGVGVICANNEPGYNSKSTTSGTIYDWWTIGSVPIGTYSVRDHTHTLTDSGHSHGVTDPGHTHTINFTVSDPGHAHSVTDDGHTHTAESAVTGITVDAASITPTVTENAVGSGFVTRGKRVGVNFFIKY